MKEEGISEKEILKILEASKKKDLSYSRDKILSSMCTSPKEITKKVYNIFSETNIGDPGLFEGTRDLEKKAIKIIGTLLGNKNPDGFILSGGTEANISAMWAARNSMDRKSPEIVIPKSAHFSFEKAADLLGIKLIKIPLKNDHSVDIARMIKKINSNTVALVGIAGSTEYGAIDNIELLSDTAVKYGLPLHIDAAFGGFVIPFLKKLGYETRPFDFSLEGVTSITVDPHKMGLAPIPCGCLLIRDSDVLKSIGTFAPYLTKKRHFTISGTRSGASAAIVYSMLKNLGQSGYRKTVKNCMEVTIYLYDGLSRLGITTFKPWMNILVFKDNGIRNSLRNKGWILSRTHLGETRLVVMPHVTMDIAKQFLKDVKEFLDKEVK
tara:strand:+ start:574 stop:1713 length:1140 start_codon:yes stop_codon:yes gene_type:complete